MTSAQESRSRVRLLRGFFRRRPATLRARALAHDFLGSRALAKYFLAMSAGFTLQRPARSTRPSWLARRPPA
eukprot:2524843-Pyramimonas_sp.AAC.1